VKAGFPIDSQTYFRNDLFGTADWQPSKTATGEDREIAKVIMDTDILGKTYGQLTFDISYSPVREADQDNYTCILHTAPLTDLFYSQDMEGNWLSIERTDKGSHTLSITNDKPA